MIIANVPAPVEDSLVMRVDLIDKLRLMVIDYAGVSLEEAVRVTDGMPYIAMYTAFRRRASRLLKEKGVRDGLLEEARGEVERIREMLVERTFQVLRKREVGTCDYHYVVWPGRKEKGWDVIGEAKKRLEGYVQVVSLVLKNSALPNPLLEKILYEGYNGGR
jgi:hypothetical protein